MRVLIVEDDLAQAQAAAKALHPFGHEITQVDDGEKALRFLKAQAVDIVILDWHLPKMSGFEILHWARTHIGAGLPIIFLTSKVLEVDIVLALEAGADDYVVKPFRMAEFAARVNVLLRRLKRNIDPDNIVRVGEYVLHPGQRNVHLRGKEIELTAKEFDLAAVLFHNLGQLLSRDVMAATAWGRELDVASRTLDTHIYRLRQKLLFSPENGLRLSAIYTHGYRLDEVKKSAVASNL
jgi:DNA-binding response OmpR family regulator